MKTILLLSFLALTSCATIMHGTRQQIPINTSPQGAYVKVNDVIIGQTPITYHAYRNKDFTLILTMDGYRMYSNTYIKQIDPLIIGNFILGGIPGLIIDFASGSAFKHSPDNIYINLDNQ